MVSSFCTMFVTFQPKRRLMAVPSFLKAIFCLPEIYFILALFIFHLCLVDYTFSFTCSVQWVHTLISTVTHAISYIIILHAVFIKILNILFLIIFSKLPLNNNLFSQYFSLKFCATQTFWGNVYQFKNIFPISFHT